MKSTRAFKIDVVNRTITETKVGSLKDYYREIGNDCHLIETGIYLDGNFDVVMVDEEGLFHEEIGAFVVMSKDLDEVMTILHGNAIVIGTDDEGADKEPKITIGELKRRIVFLPSPLALADREHKLNTPPQIISY